MASKQDLVSLGLPFTLANLLGDGGDLSDLANNTYFKAINAAGTGTVSMLKADTSDNTVINAEAGKALSFEINGSQIWQMTAAGVLSQNATNGSDFVFNKIGTGIQLKQGSNGRVGQFTLNGATPVVVGNTALGAEDTILLARHTIGGTPANFEVTARTNGTSFSVTGTAGDTSVCRYILVQTNA